MDIQVVVLFPFRSCMISFLRGVFCCLILLVNDWSDPVDRKHNGSGCGVQSTGGRLNVGWFDAKLCFSWIAVSCWMFHGFQLDCCTESMVDAIWWFAARNKTLTGFWRKSPNPPIRLTPRRPGPYTRHARMQTIAKETADTPGAASSGEPIGGGSSWFFITWIWTRIWMHRCWHEVIGLFLKNDAIRRMFKRLVQ